MSVVIKNSSKATIDIRYRSEKGIKSLMIQPGRNILTQEMYDCIKGHSGFRGYLNRDMFTINTEGAVANTPSKDPDFDYVESLRGSEDGKDILKEYALAWSISLNKKNTIENMISDFTDQYKEK